jgi:tetratricopeptide (TPR) repeat protein
VQGVEGVGLAICKTMCHSFSIKAFSVATALLLTCAASRAQSADDLIEKGDVFALKFQADEALKNYLPAEKLEPKNVRLLVRISREYRHLMSDASKTAEKLRLGGIAVDYAKRAAALGPNDPDAQLAVAISYGKLQPLASTKEKVETARIIKSEADKTIKLDPRSDLAWHVLGRWNMGYAEVTGVKRALAELVYGKLPAPTYEDAAKCFEEAIELKPDRLIHYIELGLVYSRMGRTADARRVITQGLAMKETDKDDPENKQRGRETLAKLR